MHTVTKQSALESYTKQPHLYGLNEQQILTQFIQYANTCNDPMNVYKFMQQKSICIYLANYWTVRALLFAQMGDFGDALLCVKEAKERNHIVNEHQVKIGDILEKIKNKMISAMRRAPHKTKRSANQYNFVYDKEAKTTIESLEALVETYEKNYKEAKKDIERQFSLKMHGKTKSWMSSIYEKNEEDLRKISQRMKSYSNNEAYLSMRTPISKKDPMRLTKTMDSVQLLKKKKSTQPKENHKKKLNSNNTGSEMKDQNGKNGSEIQEDSDNEEKQICVNTTPVGRQLSILSRRVTFSTNPSTKIEKIRGNEVESSLEKDSHGMEVESKQKAPQPADGVLSRRGSILKNKKMANLEQID